MSKQQQDQIDELQAQCTTLANECAALRIKLGDHDARIEQMEIAAPAELRRLTFDAVCQAIDADPYTRFEVLMNWGHAVDQLKAGSIIRADLVPHVRDFVKHGLQLGLPRDQSEVIARMRAETEARHRNALAETKLAHAEAARAEAAAAATRAQAFADGDDGRIVESSIPH